MRRFTVLISILAVLVLTTATSSAQPTHVSYQGSLLKNGVPWADPANFMFAIDCGGQLVWSSDPLASPPQNPIVVNVDRGVFTVLLGGEQNMPPITPDLLCDDAMLRIWVDTGDGPEQLPDQPFSSAAFALQAESADRSLGDFDVGGDLTVTGEVQASIIRFPGGVQTEPYTGQTGGGGDADWQFDPIDDTNIFHDTGTVTIGGTQPPSSGSQLSVLNDVYIGGDAGADGPSEWLAIRGTTQQWVLAAENAGAGNFFIGPDAQPANSKVNVTTSGNVGVGTATPSSKLEVVGGVELSSSGSLLTLRDGEDDTTVRLDGTESGGGSVLQLFEGAGQLTLELDAVEGSRSLLKMFRPNGTETVRIEAQDNDSSTDGGSIRLYDDNGQITMHLDGKQATGGSVLRLYDELAQNLLVIDGNEADEGSNISMYNESARRTIELDSHEGGEQDGVIRLYDGDGTVNIELVADHTNSNGNVRLYNDAGGLTVELDSQEADNAGEIVIYDATGTPTITLDADVGGSSRVITDVLQINGADLSENFDIHGGAGSIEPGTVVSIDPSSPGRLLVSRRAYDSRVAGVVSGAGGVRTGLLMQHPGTIASGEHPVALTGRVYCKADAAYGAIEPGDLLTTSDTDGHAMKVTDRDRAQGAILGKAMTSLQSGRGMVLVLVTLQ